MWYRSERSGMWRNWYTRYVQVVVAARPWRFKSSHAHKNKKAGCGQHSAILFFSMRGLEDLVRRFASMRSKRSTRCTENVMFNFMPTASPFTALRASQCTHAQIHHHTLVVFAKPWSSIGKPGLFGSKGEYSYAVPVWRGVDHRPHLLE